MVRFIDSKTVLLNDFSKDRNTNFKREIKRVLLEAHLDIIEIPYSCYDNSGFTDDSGDYVNFLQMEEVVFVPVYERREDEAALRIIE